jgi:exodeoxyribonuclease V alpha subunit
LKVFFEPGAGDEGKCRQLPLGLLPGHETAFALTVHKAQGSEFDRILLLVPSVSSPLLTRELLYTALTRARQRAEFWCAEETFRQAVLRRVERDSGLTDALRA